MGLFALATVEEERVDSLEPEFLASPLSLSSGPARGQTSENTQAEPALPPPVPTAPPSSDQFPESTTEQAWCVLHEQAVV